MKVKYSIPLVHLGEAAGDIGFSIDGADYKFIVQDKKLARVEIEKGQFPESAWPVVGLDHTAKKINSISIPIDPIWPDIESGLMVVEGVMALFGLTRIVFEEMTTHWIPESDADRKALGLLSFQHTYNQASDNLPVFFDLIARSLLTAKVLVGYEAALNFNRRGRDDIAARRYIDAIYDFYFSLETLFADGAFHSKKVVRNMMKKQLLSQSIEAVKSDLKSDQMFLRESAQSASFEYLGKSTLEIVEHMVDVRGFLHHHSGKHARVWHPSKQQSFKVDALFMSSLVHHVLSGEVLEKMFSVEVSEEFPKIRMRSLDGHAINFVPFDIDSTQ